MRITRAQRCALKQVYDRGPLGVTYRQFRRGVQGTFGCDGAVTIHWAGMWLLIETDGYTHS